MAKMIAILTSLPFSLFVLAVAAYWWLSENLFVYPGMENFSYAIYSVSLILSWWFNRSRIFFTTLLLALAQYALSGLPAIDTGRAAFQQEIYPVVCTLLPANILIFSLLKERGIFNAWGLTRFGIILLQLVYIALAFVTNDSTLISLFSRQFLPVDWSAVTPIPQAAAAAYGAAVVLLVKRQLRYPAVLPNALLAVLAATVTVLQLPAGAPAAAVFFSAAGLILIAAVVQDSYSMAYLDELTGLPARRALREELLKLRGEYTIAMLDIDFFKKFNDTYGHDTGDEVLRLVAGVLGKVKGGGKAFRYGGEEFTVVFPQAGMAEALPYLEELRAAVEKCPYAYQGKKKKTGKNPAVKKLFVTISIGVAVRSDKHRQAEEVIKAADTALYRAKKKGRNCVSK